MVFDDKKFIANKVRLARKKAKLTQEELAEKIGITSKQISRIEVGEYMPSVPTFLKIIDALNINIKDFGIKNEDESPIRKEILKLIYGASDSELKFCFETLKTMINNFDILKYN